MRRGQSTLEYVFLVGVGAVALIAMLVYIGRSLQGNIRNQAEQLGAWQYAPGNTMINNSETKTTKATKRSTSTTTVTYGNLNAPHPELDKAIADFQASLALIEQYKKEWDVAVDDEAKAQAAKELNAPGRDLLSWIPPPTGVAAIDQKIAAEIANGKKLYETFLALKKAWDERKITGDTTSSTSSGSAESSIDDVKRTEETLGNL
ncbi:MAG: hypothetical protein NT014_01310 [Candidatus Omnitrophica bacterium]|nr:hypothetical protein [Candidatus Omnitrophota bacterium]